MKIPKQAYTLEFKEGYLYPSPRKGKSFFLDMKYEPFDPDSTTASWFLI